MVIWKLEPVDLTSKDWACSRYRGVVTVRAPDCESAREFCASVFVEAVGILSGYQETVTCSPSPWEREELVKCTRVDHSTFKEDGEIEILDPV